MRSVLQKSINTFMDVLSVINPETDRLRKKKVFFNNLNFFSKTARVHPMLNNKNIYRFVHLHVSFINCYILCLCITCTMYIIWNAN